MNPLEQLAAALMEIDGSVSLLGRSERAILLRAGLSNVTLLDVADLPVFEADATAWNEAVKPGQNAVIVAVDSGRRGAAEVLERVVPSALLQVRAQRSAWVWVPGEKPKSVRGAAWKNLELAARAVDEGRVANPAEVIARRSQQAGDVAAFMQPLQLRKPVVTFAVAAVSVAVFGLQMLWGGGEPYVSAPRMGAAVPSLVFKGEVWRLLAPMLLHGSPAHLAMNMIALLGFGTFLERFLGWRRYLLLYVLSGLGGSLASVMRPTEVVSVGASGGIWGLMLAGAVLVTWPRGRLPTLVSVVQRKRAWTPVVINVLYSFQPGIDLLAHFGGGAIGGLLVFSGLITGGIPAAEQSNDPTRPPLRESALIKGGAVLAILALLASVGVAFAVGRPWELSGSPELKEVAFGQDAVAQLPVLTTAPKLEPDQRTWTYGSLQQDPVAFLVVLPSAQLSEEELSDVKGALEESVASFNPGLFDGFRVEVKSELRERAGRPYVYHRQVSTDGRAAESYYLVERRRLAMMMVLSSKAASTAWRKAVDEAPFSLKLAQP